MIEINKSIETKVNFYANSKANRKSEIGFYIIPFRSLLQYSFESYSVFLIAEDIKRVEIIIVIVVRSKQSSAFSWYKANSLALPSFSIK